MGVVSRTFHQPFLALTQTRLGELMVRFDAQYGSPCRFSLLHLAQRMMMSRNLQASIEMRAIAANSRFEI